MLIFSLILTIFAVGCKKDEENNTTNNGNNTVNPTPPADENTVKDIDGNIYKTVNINGKTWMAENLKVEKLNDGGELQKLEDTDDWAQAPGLTIGSYGYYNNSTTFKDSYGCLYNQKAVKTSKLCPTGWHVPSKAEWDALIAFAGGNSQATSTKLRDAATVWYISTDNPATTGTDDFGFAAKPGGAYIEGNGIFNHINIEAYWWTSEDYYVNLRYDYVMTTEGQWNWDQFNGHSVRCVKD